MNSLIGHRIGKGDGWYDISRNTNRDKLFSRLFTAKVHPIYMTKKVFFERPAFF